MATVDIGSIKVRQTIFHDIPKNKKGFSGAPTLADDITALDSRRSSILRERLIRALASRSGFPVEFYAGTSSIVPAEVQKFASGSITTAKLITLSRTLAQHLFDRQTGTVSPGLLCIIDVTVSNLPGLAILKLEREQGAELHWKQAQGKKTIEMDVLDNLVLTEGTKLFKSALFVMDGSKLEFGVACDGQPSSFTSEDMAQFWMQFLGCTFKRDPRIETQRWFDATIDYANEVVTDPVVRSSIYDHVLSELNSQRNTVSAKRFADDYVSASERKSYLDFVSSKDVSTNQFRKDLTDVAAKIKRITYHTEHGVAVTAPVAQEGLVKVDSKKITINDRLKSVANK
jgi:hypothetical protein